MRSDVRSRWAVLIIGVGGLLALISLAYSLGFVSVSADEFGKTLLACEGLRTPSAWFRGIWMPPHLMLIAVTGLVSGSPFLASRLISIFFGSLLIAAVVGIGRQIAGNRGALIAAVLTATH